MAVLPVEDYQVYIGSQWVATLPGGYMGVMTGAEDGHEGV